MSYDKPCTVYCSFSTVSSGINAGGILILEDFIQAKWPTLSSFTKFVISKITGQLFGLFLRRLIGFNFVFFHCFHLLYHICLVVFLLHTLGRPQ